MTVGIQMYLFILFDVIKCKQTVKEFVKLTGEIFLVKLG